MSELLTPTQSATVEHPIGILMREHELLLQLSARLKESAAEVALAGDPAQARTALGTLRELLVQLKEAQTHYLREENVLFPYLERHGIVGPPAVMWREHDEIRGIEKRLYQIADAGTTELRERGREVERLAGSLAELLASHFYKENNILFQAATEVLTETEWKEAMGGFSEIGFWQVIPAPPSRPDEEQAVAARAIDGVVSFESGALPVAVLEALLNTLPVDITFVDDQDTVRYFSQARDRVFPRTTAILGRKVQQCHPEKSYHAVNQILNDFREGRRDSAEFWIQSGGRFLSIRYFPVRDPGGRYLGCLEVTQDATGLRQLEGEKRLL